MTLKGLLWQSFPWFYELNRYILFPIDTNKATLLPEIWEIKEGFDQMLDWLTDWVDWVNG